MLDGSLISASGFGIGNGGNIEVNADRCINFWRKRNTIS